MNVSMLSQITLARDEAQRLTAFSGIRHGNNRHKYRLVNRLGTGYFLLVLVIDYLIDILYLIESNSPEQESRRSSRYISSFLLVQILWHFCLMRFTARWDNAKRSRTSNYQLPSHASGPWRSCHDCGRTCPPRSHHCPVCRCCVLKRDHHCFITGVCVGYHNQRHFIVLAFYSAIASLYFLRHLQVYFQSQNLDIFSRDIYQFILPVTFIKYLTDTVSLDICLLTVCMYLTLGCAIAAWLTLLQQMYLTLSGRTPYEMKSGKREYSQSVCANIVSVFGRAGLVLFVLPVPVPYSGDGFSWRYQYKFRVGP